ncbi:MFS transporter [Alkalihalobacterium chitinilyticum]|uniref:MFS transporter n=1 Tax=Alkalihalobacterium chitinilyticum TaxID=2980103 RepID=A0ABT5VID4_9BACI|nr:MFS transporter [Alkalihalobacterium chitinilyticum]MDE5414507.1 MFS transporter [Alkalihalobacterium chitinilyticum]
MTLNQKKKLWLYSLLGMLTTIVVLAFARLSYGVVLPFMRDGLHITYKEAGLLGTITSFGYVCTVMFAGVLAAKWGGKQTVLLGISIVTFGFIGLTFTPFYSLTILFMLLLGIGTAFTYTPLISLLVAWFPQQKGFVIGLTASGVGVGLLLTGVIIPALNASFPIIGWRLSWGLFAIVSFTVVLLTLLLIKNPPAANSQESNNQQSSPREIYRNPAIINVGFIYGIIGIAYIIQMLFIMSFMIEYGVSATLAGQLIALNGILSIFSGPIWGIVSDKLGRRKSLILTMALTLMFMLLPILYPTLLGFIVHMVGLSCTLIGLFTLIQAASMDQVKPADMPLAFSYVTLYFAVGQFIGPTIAGWLIDDWGGFKGAFLFSSICLSVGLVLCLKVRSTVQQTEAQPKVSAEMN